MVGQPGSPSLRSGPLAAGLVNDQAVVLVQQGAGSFSAYTTEADRLPEQLGRRRSLLASSSPS